MHVWATVDLCHGVGGGGEDKVEGQLQEQGLPRCRGCPHPLCHCHRHHLSLWGICEYILLNDDTKNDCEHIYFAIYKHPHGWLYDAFTPGFGAHSHLRRNLDFTLLRLFWNHHNCRWHSPHKSPSVSLSASPLSPPDLTNRQIFIIFWLLTSRFTRWSEDFSCNSGRLNSLGHQRCHSLRYCIRPR